MHLSEGADLNFPRKSDMMASLNYLQLDYLSKKDLTILNLQWKLESKN